MKKTILATFLLSNIISADIVPPNSIKFNKNVYIKLNPAFKNYTIIYCPLEMSRDFTCRVIKDGDKLTKYKFSDRPYLFAIKNSTFKKYGKIDGINSKSFKETLKKRYDFLKSPVEVSKSYYINKSKVTSNNKNIDIIYTIKDIKNGQLVLEELK